MTFRPRVAVLLFVLGIAALTNPLWLFPAEGEDRYTYERSEITIDNGTLVYEGRLHNEIGATVGYLNDIDCQGTDGFSRGCALDYSVTKTGPVTVPESWEGRDRPVVEYAQFNGTYYHRLRIENATGLTFDVEQVSPEDVREELAVNVSRSEPDLSQSTHPGYVTAVTGEPVTSVEPPIIEGGFTGSVYQDGDTFFTIAITNETTVNYPVFGEWTRAVLYFVGLVLILLGPLNAVPESWGVDE